MAIRNRVFVYAPVLLAALVNPAWASGPSQSPDAGQHQRNIKALSPSEIADLEAGRGMGLSRAAELNHYPGPSHVLELAEPLRLTDAQLQAVKHQQQEMKQRAQQLGKQILAKEAGLESLFASGRANAAQARLLIGEIAQLSSALRFAHVNAHLATTRILSQQQIAAYDRLRGYTADAAVNHSHQH